MPTNTDNSVRKSFGNGKPHRQIHEDAMVLIESIGVNVSAGAAGKISDIPRNTVDSAKKSFGNEKLYRQIHEDAMMLIESIGVNVSTEAAGKIIDAISPEAANRIFYAEDLGKIYLTREVIDEGLDRVRQGFSYWPRGFGTGGMAAYLVDDKGPRISGLDDMKRLSKIFAENDLFTTLQSSFNLTNRVKKSNASKRADIECACIDIMLDYSGGKLITPTILTQKGIGHLGNCFDKGHTVGASLSITSTCMTVSDEMTEPFLGVVNRGIPFVMNSMPIGGLTAPYSMSSVATLAHAEAVFGLVLAQLIHPGIKCVHAAMPTVADMSKKEMPLMFGSRSNTMLNILMAELNAYLAIPGCQSACSHSLNELDGRAEREAAETYSLVNHYDYLILRHMFGFAAQLNDFSIDFMERQIDFYRDVCRHPVPVELPEPAEYDAEGLEAIFEGLEREDFKTLPHTLQNIGHSFTD